MLIIPLEFFILGESEGERINVDFKFMNDAELKVENLTNLLFPLCLH